MIARHLSDVHRTAGRSPALPGTPGTARGVRPGQVSQCAFFEAFSEPWRAVPAGGSPFPSFILPSRCYAAIGQMQEGQV